MILGFLRVFGIGLILMSAIYILTSVFMSGGLAAGYRKDWQRLSDAEREGTSRDDWVRMKVETHRCGIRVRAFMMSFALLSIGVLATIIIVN